MEGGGGGGGRRKRLICGMTVTTTKRQRQVMRPVCCCIWLIRYCCNYNMSCTSSAGRAYFEPCQRPPTSQYSNIQQTVGNRHTSASTGIGKTPPRKRGRVTRLCRVAGPSIRGNSHERVGISPTPTSPASEKPCKVEPPLPGKKCAVNSVPAQGGLAPDRRTTITPGPRATDGLLMPCSVPDAPGFCAPQFGAFHPTRVSHGE